MTLFHSLPFMSPLPHCTVGYDWLLSNHVYLKPTISQCFLSHLLSFVFYCDNQDTDLKCFQLRLVFVFLQQQHLQPPQMMLHNILRTVPAGVECGANTLFMNCQLSQKCGVMFCTVCNEQYASSQKLKTTLCLFVKSRSWYHMCRTFVRILTLIWLLELK